MTKLDHLAITVRDYRKSRDWYVAHLGLKIEFEVADRLTAALQDDAGLTLFVQQGSDDSLTPSCVLYFRVDDVEEKYRELSSGGLSFVHEPSKEYWGFGAELRDPDGYSVRLWDEKSMREKGRA